MTSTQNSNNLKGGHLVSFEDRSLECSDCGTTFTFTADEQELFASRGYSNDPKRCPECRAARKSKRQYDGNFGTQREMHPAVCAECGQETQVPFKPREDRPVYCSDCYRKIKPGR